MPGDVSGTRRAPLPRTVLLLGWVSFFADVSTEMSYPLLPLLVVGVLGAPATMLGGIEGTAQAAVAILTAISGWHSDRSRRRVVLIRWGYGLPVLGKALLASASAWPIVLVGRGIDRVGKGMRSSPRDAMIADAVGSRQRGRAFGFHRAMDTAGALTGVLLSALLLVSLGAFAAPGEASDSEATIRAVFGVSAVLAVASLILTLALRDRDPAPHPDPAGAASDGEPGPPGFGARFWLVLGMLAVFAIANSSPAFLLLRAAGVGLSPVAVVLAYALYNFAHAIAAYPAGALSDRLGRWRMIGAGWLVYAVAYAGFAVTGPGGVWPLMALYGCSVAMTEGVGKALIADHAPARRRGTAIGIMYLALGLAALVSNLIAGWLWDAVGPAAPFRFGAVAALAALVLLVVTRGFVAR